MQSSKLLKQSLNLPSRHLIFSVRVMLYRCLNNETRIIGYDLDQHKQYLWFLYMSRIIAIIRGKNVFKRDKGSKKYTCTIAGALFIGDEMPKACPIYKHLQAYLEALKEIY